MRLSWPQIADKGLKRLQGQGSYFAEQQNFQVNLYRIRSGEKWPETPINSKSSHDNYYHRIQDTLPIEKYHSKSSCTLSLEHPVTLKLIIRDKTLYAGLNSSLTNCESVVLSDST